MTHPQLLDPSTQHHARVDPLCPVFTECGGCAYQDIAYEEELALKELKIRSLFAQKFDPDQILFDPILASPEPYHYRHRLDITMKRTRHGILTGFQTAQSRRVIEISSCAIAKKNISDFLSRLREEGLKKFSEKYRTANLVVRTGDDHRILWGGIGRKSLQLDEKDYLWTEIHGKRIFYSLDSFFQANLSILPPLMEKINSWIRFSKETVFFDLYAGVGLFGVYFSSQTRKVVFIEDSPHSVKLLKFNAACHQLSNAEWIEAKVESSLPSLMRQFEGGRKIAIVDPPRKGLHPEAAKTLVEAQELESLLYLSCNPESLIRDLEVFKNQGWTIKRVCALDFFPKTRHIEALVLLTPRRFS